MAFINCDTTGNELSEVLDILENNSDILLKKVDDIVEEIDGYVTDGLFGITKDVEEAAKNIEDTIEDIIPDYTNRSNNIGKALEKYDSDLEEFKKLLKNCPQVKLPQFIGKLELGIKLPDLPDVDWIFFEYSGIRKSLLEMSRFPSAYLNSIRNDILSGVISEIHGISGGLKEFICATGLDDLNNLVPDKLLNLAQKAEALINCVEGIACSDLAQQIDRYHSIMLPLPLDPPYIISTDGKFKKMPLYSLDTSSILTNTVAGSGQIQNLITAKNSATKAMTYARNMTSKF